jgi:exocyst complex protein 7
MGAKTESQRRLDALNMSLKKMQSSTNEAGLCCDQLSKRARQLDSLTSPASDASSMLSKASNNLGATLVLMKDAREKFDTIIDCEPAIERLHRGIVTMQNERSGKAKKARHNPFGDKNDKDKNVILSEQDVYAAADSMEIIRDAYDYFIDRKHWRSTAQALSSLERVHQMGVSSMCILESFHLIDSGQAVRIKRVVKQEGDEQVTPANETAQQTRDRLAAALQNRDLLRSIGEFEEQQPVEARLVRELRGIFECLSGNGFQLVPQHNHEPPGLAHHFGIPANRVVRTEKVGSGIYTNLVQRPLKTGFPHVDAYGESRKTVAFQCVDQYYRRLKGERKRNAEQFAANVVGDPADAASRDAVRCLEHAMVVVAGEKNVYRTIVSPSLTKIADEDAINEDISPYYRKACAAAYSHIASVIVDKTMDIIETVFLKEGCIGHASGTGKGDAPPPLTVRQAASAAAAGLRMLDGVRMLGPSLAKLCDMPIGDGGEEPQSLASILCIAIHRTTVKNTARTLENLAKAINEDPVKGSAQRVKDARVALLTIDVVRAVKLISPFDSAYKSVSKRRQLPWDPNMGEEAGELDSFIRFLVMRLVNSLKGKALNYTKHVGDIGHARSSMFMMNNSFFLRDELGPKAEILEEDFRIESSWFVDKINKLFESEKGKYLGQWEALNTHLTSVEHDELEYQKNDTILSLDSGRLIKSRFSGFNEGKIVRSKVCHVLWFAHDFDFRN